MLQNNDNAKALVQELKSAAMAKLSDEQKESFGKPTDQRGPVLPGNQYSLKDGDVIAIDSNMSLDDFKSLLTVNYFEDRRSGEIRGYEGIILTTEEGALRMLTVSSLMNTFVTESNKQIRHELPAGLLNGLQNTSKIKTLSDQLSVILDSFKGKRITINTELVDDYTVRDEPRRRTRLIFNVA